MLKATATFSFDRYIAGKFDSYSVRRGVDNNKEPSLTPQETTQDNFERALLENTTTAIPGVAPLGLSGDGFEVPVRSDLA